MKIFLTGGCGFIGSNYVLNQVLEHNNEVMNYDILTYSGNINNVAQVSNHDNYTFVNGDICDTELLLNSINNFNPDCIIHFAAESHVDRSINRPNDFIQTNIIGTSYLLNATRTYLRKNESKKSSFKFIHISTDEVFGSLGESGYFDENSPYAPRSPYSASKAASDHIVRAWGETYGLPYIITNCSNNYGPYQFPEKLIPLMITNCLKEKPLPVYGNGCNVRDWLYVDDHCEAIDLVLEKGNIGETYCIGGNNEIQNIDIVYKICEILDKKKPRKSNSYKDLIQFTKDRPGHDFRYAINSTKIRKQLNWSPKESFETGILLTIDWYLKNEFWWQEIKNKLN